MEIQELFGIKYAVTDRAEAVPYVRERLDDLRGSYVCFSNVHTIVMALENEDYRKSLNKAAFTFPDGVPVARRLRRAGAVKARRVAGPDFMDAMLRSTSDGTVRHFFYGSTSETISKLEKSLKSRYPNIAIAGMYSPPFRELSEGEEKEIYDIISEAKPDIIWIGLGAPKQEYFMCSHLGRFDGVMFGVGAAFDFLAGTSKRAPKLIQKLSLEWLYRVVTDPRRLSKRYIITNSKYMLYCMTHRYIL